LNPTTIASALRQAQATNSTVPNTRAYTIQFSPEANAVWNGTVWIGSTNGLPAQADLTGMFLGVQVNMKLSWQYDNSIRVDPPAR
jgi:hypothetical protein